MTTRKFNDMSAMEALRRAQAISVGPFVFQAVAAMEDLGILKILGDLGPGETVTREEMARRSGVSLYGVSALLDLAVTADIVIEHPENGGLSLSKVGIYLTSDPMTRVNLAFTRHVCYQGLEKLTDSLKTGRPEGLRVFTEDHDTIYPFLKDLPEKAREAWFGFDHFYSDRLFPKALPELFGRFHPRLIYDVGGNTGKFALAATDYDPEVKVTVIDLPEQCEKARENFRKAGRENRAQVFPADILREEPALPGEADIWWLSQFLDCFSAGDISGIISRIYQAARPDAVLAVNEILGDRQKNEVASLVVDATSLYFTALANGRSRFYHARELISLIEGAGFKLFDEIDHLGMGHTVMFFRKKSGS